MNQAAQTTVHANASNSRFGANHKQWFASNSFQPDTHANFLITTANASREDGEAKIGLSTFKNGGSTTQLSRVWGDDALALTAKSMALPKEIGERAFSIASRMLGLGKAGSEQPAARAGSTAERFLACAEFDADFFAQGLFVELARKALRSKGDTHLCLHLGYGRANAYRGTHLMIDIDSLLSNARLSASSRIDGRGSSIHVTAEIEGQKFDVLSFKRKGGEGPSENRADQLQATLLVRGATKAAQALDSTATLLDTGRRIVHTLPAALAEGLEACA